MNIYKAGLMRYHVVHNITVEGINMKYGKLIFPAQNKHADNFFLVYSRVFRGIDDEYICLEANAALS
jgi:hypothetical protein